MAFLALLEAQGMEILGIASSHLLRLETLPFHHRDPFDRMIAAQALAENLPLLSQDLALLAYGIGLKS